MLTCQFGHYVLFSIQDWQIKRSWEQKVLANIPESYLERIVDNKDLHWEEPGREFSFRGSMYDVVRSRKEEGKTIHFAVNDRQEEQLIQVFSRLMKDGPDNNEGSRGGKLQWKLQTLLFTIPEDPNQDLSLQSARHEHPAASSLLVSRPHSVIPFPPWA